MTKMLKEREINYLGALLHDIGKFKWRAQKLTAGDDHEKLGEEFIREYLGKIDILRDDIENIIKAANRSLGKVHIADTTAAKERQGIEDKTPRRPLASILQRISKVKNENTIPVENFYYYNPEKLDIFVQFPLTHKKSLEQCSFDDNEMIEKHKIIWEEFLKEVLILKNSKNFKVFLNSFYHLLEKYTTKVLSAGYLSYPDLSLFDHSRVVAALSICIEETDKKEKECILVQGDLSGIQDYVYNEIYKTDRAAKKLRGRSFYVTILTEIISSFILENLQLFQPNLLYNGGGHFLMLIPNNKENKEMLDRLEKDINQKLFNKYSGKLQFVLGYIEENANQIFENLSSVYKKLSEEVTANKKKQKSYSILENLFSDPIDFKKVNGQNELLDREELTIGTKLPRSNFLIEVYSGENKQFEKLFKEDCVSFSEFNRYVIFSDDKVNSTNMEKIIANLKSLNLSQINIIRLNDVSFLNEEFFRKYELPLSCSFRFIGNYAPEYPGQKFEIMSFEDLAKMNSENYPMLGISRMDLDSLGAAFAFGLKEGNEQEKKYTISRIASLSRELVHFFCGHINKIAKDNQIYIAYSGGDDVFAVGSWVNIISFNQQVKDEFSKFVCKNPNLTISCGVSFTKPKFPIAASAKLAGEEERKAKNEDEVFKNMVSTFSTIVKWEDFENLIEFGKGLFNIVSKKESETESKIPRSFIHSLLALTKNCFDDKGRIRITQIYKSSSRLHYLFGRRKITEDKIEKYDDKLKDYKIELAKNFLKSKNPEIYFKHFTIPASYIIYKTRN